MRKLLLYLLTLILTLPSWGQEKLFNEAIKRGRGWGNSYVLVNEKNKYITIDQLVTAARKGDNVVFNYTTKPISRFGDVTEAISTADFIPKEEYASYIYENLVSEFSKVPFTDLSQEGGVYLYNPQKDKPNEVFQLIENGCKWSGAVSDGKIEGSGVGFCEVLNGYILIRGSFKAGIPQGEFVIKHFKTDLIQEFKSDHVAVVTRSVGDFREGLAPFLSDGKYGFIDAHARVVISSTYDSVEEGFKGGKAKVRKDKEFWIDKVGKFIAYTEHQKKLDYEATEKKKREEAEARQREIEAQKERERQQRVQEENERYRRQRAKELEAGDEVVYRWGEGRGLFGLFSYSERVTCFVVRNDLRNQKVLVRVQDIETSDGGYEITIFSSSGYKKVKEGDLVWVDYHRLSSDDEGWSY